MVANDPDASGGVNVVRRPDPRAERSDTYADDNAAAARAFLAAVRGETDQQPRSAPFIRSPRGPGRRRRPVVDLPCQQHDPGLWFAQAPVDVERAKALCAVCPIRLACLAVAVDNKEFAGVWGGHIFDRGKIVAQKRPRGRPPKHQTERAASPHRAAPAALSAGSVAERAAAVRLYDAECALDSAQHSGVGTWIDAANRSLRAAATDYLVAATPSGPS